MIATPKSVKHDPSVVEALRAHHGHRAGLPRHSGWGRRSDDPHRPRGLAGRSRRRRSEEVVAEWIHVRVEKLRKSSDEEVSASLYREHGPLEPRFGDLLEEE